MVEEGRMEGEETESVQSLQGGGGGGGGAECVQLVVEFSGEGEGFGRREEVQPGIGRGEDAGLDPCSAMRRERGRKEGREGGGREGMFDVGERNEVVQQGTAGGGLLTGIHVV